MWECRRCHSNQADDMSTCLQCGTSKSVSQRAENEDAGAAVPPPQRAEPSTTECRTTPPEDASATPQTPRSVYPRTFALDTTGSWLVPFTVLLAFTICVALLGAWWLSEGEHELGYWTKAGLIAVVCGGGPLFFVLEGAFQQWRKSAYHPRVVHVDARGVLVGRRFIPLADILRVEHHRRTGSLMIPVYGDAYREEERCEWRVSVVLRARGGEETDLDGEVVEFRTNMDATNFEDPFGAELAHFIEAAFSDHRRLHESHGLPGEQAGPGSPADQ